MESVMRNGRETPKPRASRNQARQRPREIPDEKEIRLGRELRHLMQDPRYMEGDPDYRAYIQRQYRRVYDDPSGKPDHLVVGRPATFVDAIEPFNQTRERRFRLGIQSKAEVSSGEQSQSTRPSRRTILGGAPEAGGSAQRRTSGSSVAAADRRHRDAAASSSSQSDFDITPPSERAMTNLEGNARRHGPDPEDARRSQLDRLEQEERLRRTGKSIDAMIASWRRDGSLLGAEFLQRYRDGAGGTRPIAWSELMTFPKFRREQERLKGHYLDWVRDELEDPLWTPFLDLEDGQSVRVWTNGGGKRLKLTVNWDPVTRGSVLDLNDGKDRDFARAMGRSEIEGIGDLRFTRRDGIIYVSGIVEMSVDEKFDFEPGVLGFIGSTAAKGAPSVSNRDLMDYVTFGPGETFRTTSTRLWQVTGRIVLREDGTPDPDDTVLFWSEPDGEKAR